MKNIGILFLFPILKCKFYIPKFYFLVEMKVEKVNCFKISRRLYYDIRLGILFRILCSSIGIFEKDCVDGKLEGIQ